MKKNYVLGEGQHYVAGKRGIRFQNNEGVLVARKPGDPVPEATGFKNIRVLVGNDRLIIEDIPKGSDKKPTDKKPEVKDPEKKPEDKKPDSPKDDKTPAPKDEKKPEKKPENDKKPDKKSEKKGKKSGDK